MSNGMLCSGKELGLSDDQAGLLILGDEAPGEPGTPLMDALGLEHDVVFDITVEGNRPDAWCMTGIARDLAGRLGLVFSAPEPPEPAPGGPDVASLASATVESLDLCPRLTVSVVEGVTVGPSPQWIARRLLLAGMRPINNVVDASNYVMLELGQPTHPYDLARLPGRGLSVRRAREGETVDDPRRGDADRRRPGPEPRRHRRGLPHLRRRGHAGRHRRHHGRRLVGDRRHHDRGPARGGVLHPDGHRADLQAPRSADRGLGAL